MDELKPVPRGLDEYFYLEPGLGAGPGVCPDISSSLIDFRIDLRQSRDCFLELRLCQRCSWVVGKVDYEDGKICEIWFGVLRFLNR